LNTEDFLKRVLPASGGDYFGVTISDAGPTTRKFSTVEELNAWVDRYRTSKNVYFATGVYDAKRQIKHTKLKKALYVDLDVGAAVPGKPPKYATKKEALSELLEYCRDKFLPPSLIVDSGGGIHAYWVFDQPMPLARWTALATEFKKHLADNGVLADPAVTGDAARILRVPNTMNFKTGRPHPLPSRVVHSSPKDYSQKEVTDKLNISDLRTALALVVDNDDLSGGVQQHERKWYASKMIPNCPMFADALATGGADLPENLWVQQLHVLAYTEDGEQFVHEISKGHSGYTQPATQLKWNQRTRAKDTTGPTKCETFAQWSPHCAACPHRGEITTPLQLGTDRDVSLPYPYNQDDKGVYLMVDSVDDDGVQTKVRASVFQYKVTDFTVVYADGHTHIQFVASIGGALKPVELDLADISDRKACTKTLASYHAVLMYNEYNNFRDFMNTWAKKMQDAKRTQRSWSQLGWTNNPEGFALADEVILRSGARIKNLSSDRVLHGLFRPTGDVALWKRAAELLMANDRMESIMAVGTSFGAPLSPWLRDASAMMSFVSKGSGTGKSTALEVAQAVWGHPKHALFQLDDTQNSVYRKLSFANNLPGYWDELKTKDDTAKMGRMLFHLTGGRDKTRLTQSIDLRESAGWSTILSAASNDSIADIANQTSRDTEAGRARVFEVTIPVLQADERLVELDALMVDLGKNFGTAGVIYVEFLLRNEDACRAIVQATHKRLAKKLGSQSSERFWLSLITKILCGLMFAKKCGLIDVDLAAAEQYLCAAFMRQRANMVENYGSSAAHSTELLMEFMSEFAKQLTVYDHLPTPHQPIGRVYHEPRIGEVVGSVGAQDKRLRVTRRAFHGWLFDNKLGTPSTVLMGLPYSSINARVTAGGVGAKLKCYDFDLPAGTVGSMEDFTEFEE
jgi:hypothetical protein